MWVIAGAGGNITVQAGDAKAAGPGAGEGVLLVDTGAAGMTVALLAEIQRITPGRIEYIVNTNADPDHVGGNETLAKPHMDFLWTPGSFSGPGVKMIGHENVLPRMSLPGPDGKVPIRPSHGRPTPTRWRNGGCSSTTSRSSSCTCRRPHDGDSIVFFRRSDVIAAGDIFDATLSRHRARARRQRGGHHRRV